MTVKIFTRDKKIVLESPYHPDLPSQAKAIGGRFNGQDKTWSFDLRDEERVRETARHIYGTDGNDAKKLVTVQMKVWGRQGSKRELWAFGRRIARRPGRDMNVQLGDGVIIVEGKFGSSGGSRNYPVLLNSGSVTVEIRDVPESLAFKAIEENIDYITIVDETPAPESVTVTVTGTALEHLARIRERTDLTDDEIVATALALLEKNV